VSLHGLTSITLGVPDVEAVCGYYEEFGLTPSGVSADGRRRRFSTLDGGEQLAVTQAPQRRLPEIGVGADDPDDLDRIESSLARLGAEWTSPESVEACTMRSSHAREAQEVRFRVQGGCGPHCPGDR
jgi:hypothetical protein